MKKLASAACAVLVRKISRNGFGLTTTRTLSSGSCRIHWHCEEFIRDQKDNSTHEKRAIIIVKSDKECLHRFINIWNSADFRICADSGANDYCDHLDNVSGEIPHAVVGDLDSIRPEVQSTLETRGTEISHSACQDSTDLDKSMMFIKQKEQTMQTKYDSIGVIGALGRNFSQEVGNINLLYHHAPRKIYFMSNHNLVFLLSPGSHTVHLHQEEPKAVSYTHLTLPTNREV
eukprot:TRINITY_DN1515_c0_g1_i4.p1 TRINITY_DN1515_c0_g1~~TRINITY_DN1515_c0_g1_i4.p1  ORF type:complete len:231 (+),score=14.21 TRINITY_DN1515_c0_g1_i4:1-693(+)